MASTRSSTWGKVTIRNTLNMQSGMGPDGYDANWDSKSINTYEWAYSYALADQIRHYFNQEPNPNVAGPGQKMVYMDQDMWIATLAMQRFLQSKEGPDATILNMLETEVYAPIGAPHFVSGTNYTPDGSIGFPFSAWGALPTIDTLARAGQLIANGGKGPDGSQILDPVLVAGLSANPDYGLAFRRTVAEHGDATLNVPGMHGAGGNIVLSLPAQVLFPSGVAELSEDGKIKVHEIGFTLKDKGPKDDKGNYTARYLVVGHSDNQPLKNSVYKDNWELSTARALTVTRELVAAGMNPKNLLPSGAGDHDPLTANTSVKDMGRNRRIEIVLLPAITEMPETVSEKEPKRK